MLDEKLSCLLDESEDEITIANDTTYKNNENYSTEKNIRNEKYKNSSSSILNFNIRNLGNLDNFFKKSNENKNSKQSNNDKINSNLNDNTLFYNSTKQKDENNSDILKTNYINENEKNTMNTELKEKHAQLKAYSSDKSLNNKNVIYDEISKCPDDSFSSFSQNEKKKKNFENESQNEGSVLSNRLNNFHNDKINASCKLNKSHNESEYKKKYQDFQKKKGSFFNEENYLEKKNKEKMIDNIICERNNFSETNLYKEHFKMGEIRDTDTLKEKHLSNNIKKNYYESFESNNTYLSDRTSVLVKTNNESKYPIKNNKVIKDNTYNSHFNLNEMSLINNKSYNSFNSIEFITNDGNKNNITILNSNSTKSNSLMGPAGLQHKIKKYSNKKSKQLIYCFSFIKYKSWIKGLQILNLPLDPFHLSINSHKYINNNPSNESFLYKYNIHNILNNKKFSNYRIERMIVLVKTIVCRSHGYFLLVMDPSGQMPASLHKEVESEYKKNIDVGCTLLLRNVTIFDTIDNFPYLIITLRSLVRVIKAEETDYITKEKIYNQLHL
ncbi:conserved Plasmodium protein, unknown function [Plasmodium relictum]|uniref:Homologous recombination OB-fold protein OB-fold domain-containing protein n=1 Tax=Plasmodium relictum TaxID=85471 RepID=A0A1J1H853_PLARL|nr:conserved Plasmodium protein, unknown function [Plasmodium relictum]CRH00966.1 conserved Plasmodium protein, unknown function [Plasmodium relictum]